MQKNFRVSLVSFAKMAKYETKTRGTRLGTGRTKSEWGARSDVLKWNLSAQTTLGSLRQGSVYKLIYTLIQIPLMCRSKFMDVRHYTIKPFLKI